MHLEKLPSNPSTTHMFIRLMLARNPPLFICSVVSVSVQRGQYHATAGEAVCAQVRVSPLAPTDSGCVRTGRLPTDRGEVT